MIFLYHVTDNVSGESILNGGFHKNRIYFTTKKYVTSWAKCIRHERNMGVRGKPLGTDDYMVAVEVLVSDSFLKKQFIILQEAGEQLIYGHGNSWGDVGSTDLFWEKTKSIPALSSELQGVRINKVIDI